MYDVLIDSIYGTEMVFALIDTNDDALTIVNVNSIEELNYHEGIPSKMKVGDTCYCDYDKELKKNMTKVVRIK